MMTYKTIMKLLFGHSFFHYFKANPNRPNQALQEYYSVDQISGGFVVQYSKPKINLNPNENSNTFLYGLFESPQHFHQWYTGIRFNRRYFFESIQSGPQKMHYDIDISDKDCIPELFNITYAEELKDKVIELTREIIPFDLEKDIILCSSHGAHKFSYHIIINNYYLADNAQCKEIYNRVKERLTLQDGEFIDHMVYSPFQQFRLLHSQKPGSNRPKIFCKEWNFKRTKIVHQYTANNPHTNIDEDYQQFIETLVGHIKPSDKLIKINVTPPNRPINNSSHFNLSNIEYDELLDLLPDPDAFSIIGPVKGNSNLISLRRLRPTDCSICDREHEHENPFIIIYNNAIYWDCRRRDKSYT